MIAPLFPPLKDVIKINEHQAVLYSFISMAILYGIFSQTFSPITRQLQFAFVCFCVITGILGLFKKIKISKIPLNNNGDSFNSLFFVKLLAKTNLLLSQSGGQKYYFILLVADFHSSAKMA